MSLRDLFGGVPPPFKLPGALGTPGQVLVPTGTSSTLVWANTTSGQLVDSGSGLITPTSPGSGSISFNYFAYKLDNSIVVDVYSTSGGIELTNPGGICSTGAQFAAYAPPNPTGGAAAFSQAALTSGLGLTVWRVQNTGILQLAPLNYVAGQPFTLLPCTLIWQSP